MQVILASASLRRKQLFRRLGIPFKTIPSRVKEKLPKYSKNPKKLAIKLAFQKSIEVAKNQDDALVIGADTIVVLENQFLAPEARSSSEIDTERPRSSGALKGHVLRPRMYKVIGKPKNLTHAKQILRELSGSTQYVITGLAIINTAHNKTLTSAVSTKVKMKKMSERQINHFAKKHLDKAGAYAAQENGDEFIKSIEGSFSNVVGFPLERLQKLLKKFKLQKPNLTDPLIPS